MHKLLHIFHKQCSECGNGFVNIWQDKSVGDGQVWRCSNSRCLHKIFKRRESFFEDAHLTIEVTVKIMYFWSHKYTQDIIIYESGISNKTVV